jgi:hypothetical protein
LNTLYIHDRKTVECAEEFLTLFGVSAAFEASARAHKSRTLGNVPHYCHWRTVERLILSLADMPEDVTLH